MATSFFSFSVTSAQPDEHQLPRCWFVGVRGGKFVRRFSDDSDIRKVMASFPGGSVELQKNDEKGIAKILLNNPSKKNAFSGQCFLP